MTLSILTEVPGLETVVIARDSQLSFTRNKMKTIPRKKSYICGTKVGKSVQSTLRQKANENNKNVFSFCASDTPIL